MNTTAPIQITADIPAMRLILLGLGILFIVTMTLKTFTGRTHRGQTSGDAGPHASRPWSSVLVPAIFGVGLLIAGVILVGVLTLAPMREQESSPDAHLSETTDASFVDRVKSVDVTPTATEPSATVNNAEASDDESVEVPSWATKEETIISTGEVPSILFVEKSGLYSSKEEAMADATKNAVGNFHSRLAETWKKLAVQPVPEGLFQEASVQKVYTEKRIHSFGAYDEPMYRVYLQYLDSAATREPIIEAWKSTFAGNRAIQFGALFGIFTLGLGVVSAGLRAVSAAKGSRG
ncbi:MAG: hypothetical protein ACKVHE_08460 [Planctomycetales bacterium]|jgi:hypothetical protein